MPRWPGVGDKPKKKASKEMRKRMQDGKEGREGRRQQEHWQHMGMQGPARSEGMNRRKSRTERRRSAHSFRTCPTTEMIRTSETREGSTMLE